MESETTQKLSLIALTAMVVGSMVGAGIFSLPRTFANATGPFGAVVAWCIAGGGMYALARVFRVLAERKPHLDAGIYAYARAGFGAYAGFLSAFGYWLVGFPTSWLLGFHTALGGTGIWLGLAFALATVGVIMVLRFERLTAAAIARGAPA